MTALCYAGAFVGFVFVTVFVISPVALSSIREKQLQKNPPSVLEV